MKIKWFLVFFICLNHCNIELKAQRFIFGEEIQHSNPGINIYPYFPDGHITFGKYGQDKFFKVWAGFDSYITIGKNYFSQNEILCKAISKGDSGSFDNGGAWLYSVFPLDSLHWLGYYHAEDHQFPGYSNPNKIAWKSIARCESFDGGKTWIKDKQIITSNESKPNIPSWGGSADYTVVYHKELKSWFVYFVVPDGIGMARSEDSLGRVGTWYKWNQGNFSEPGIGGRATPLDFSKDFRRGGNPSIIYFKKLQKWVMVYHDWELRGIYITFSNDLINWEFPRLLIRNENVKSKFWYPNLIGEENDVVADSNLYLSYAYFSDKNSSYRKYITKKLIWVEENSQNQVAVNRLLLVDTSMVSVSAYNMLGQKVATVYQNEKLLPGEYSIPIELLRTKGIVIIKIKVDDVEKTYKIIKD